MNSFRGTISAAYDQRFVSFSICAVWDNVYGFDMSPIKRLVMLEPLVDIVEADAVNSDTTTLLVRFLA